MPDGMRGTTGGEMNSSRRGCPALFEVHIRLVLPQEYVLTFFNKLIEHQLVRCIAVEFPVCSRIEVNHQDRSADFHFRIEGELQQAHLDMQLIHPRCVRFIGDTVGRLHLHDVQPFGLPVRIEQEVNMTPDLWDLRMPSLRLLHRRGRRQF